MIIKSKDNAKLKLIRQLEKKKYRDIEEKFIVESKKFVIDAIKLGADIDFILLDEKNSNDNLVDFFNENSQNYFLVNHKLFNEISNTVTTQGVIAVANQIKTEYNKKDKFIVFLDDIQDPGNLGTIIRTSLAFGADLLVLSDSTVDAYNAKTTRATAAAIFKQKIIRVKDKSEFLNLLKNNNVKIISTVVDSKKEIKNVSIDDKICLIIGNEGRGVSDEVKNLSDDLVTIKMSGDQESLNASIAAGISIYEVSNIINN